MLRQAVVLVGGLGTRLGPLTAETPKPMLPVAGEPFLDILLRNIERHGITDILLLARHHAGKIRDHYASGHIGRATVRVLEETARAGTGGALREAAAELDPEFLLMNGDSFFDFNYLALVEKFRSSRCTLAMALRHVPDPSRYGQVTVDATGKVMRFAEKQAASAAPGLINGGVYLASRQVLDGIGPGEVSLEVDIMPGLVARGAMTGIAFDGYFLDIGLPETYARAQTELPEIERRRVVFLDRDGTLNKDDGYTHRAEDLHWLPGAIAAIRRCNDAGRLVIVITNQAGIARGHFPEAQMHRFHAEMNRQLQDHGAHVDAFYFCPHHPDGTIDGLATTCRCRKPGTGLLEQACAEWRIDLTDAVMVGDKPSDWQAAAAFGIRALHSDGTDLDKLIEEAGL